MLGIQDDLWASYCFYGGLILLKLVVMSPLAGLSRMKKKVFSNEEDAKMAQGKVTLNDPDVERIRRAHLDDIENIVPFLLIAPIYLTTDPCKLLAVSIFRVFTLGRYMHTITYLNEVQPWRAVGFFLNIFCNFFMIGCTIVHYAYAF
uniref:Microsomal glutathione S-transferase 1 n=1 Tax=Caligus clemensi TaxID=344056 RepID=C1C106_CALCM|nr:Microsomal glutathione S-transferase 1 [Caligus clemensi]